MITLHTNIHGIQLKQPSEETVVFNNCINNHKRIRVNELTTQLKNIEEKNSYQKGDEEKWIIKENNKIKLRKMIIPMNKFNKTDKLLANSVKNKIKKAQKYIIKRYKGK